MNKCECCGRMFEHVDVSRDILAEGSMAEGIPGARFRLNAKKWSSPIPVSSELIETLEFNFERRSFGNLEDLRSFVEGLAQECGYETVEVSMKEKKHGDNADTVTITAKGGKNRMGRIVFEWTAIADRRLK